MNNAKQSDLPVVGIDFKVLPTWMLASNAMDGRWPMCL